MLDLPLVELINECYYKKILGYRGLPVQPVGHLFKVQGFDSYNNLLDINSIFSSNPRFFPIDRTEYVNGPIKFHVPRPWKIPNQDWDLGSALEHRAINLVNRGEKINLFWSGGIDSTTMVTAFLRHAKDWNQLRILYSPWSTYEHPEYLTFLKKQFNDVELLDISGEIYMDMDLDGLMITGDGGDEMAASLDESFLEFHGFNVLCKPWKDFFYEKNPNDDFIDFCQEFFSRSGRTIETVLESRWWFYVSSKVDSILRTKISSFPLPDGRFTPDKVLGFFDCYEYENYIYWNIDKVIYSNEYSTWKQHHKDYCFEFDGFGDWRENKKKFTSVQLTKYIQKKTVLNDRRWLMILQDGTRIHTPSLPILTQREFDQAYGNSLDYLFNDPDKI